MNIIYTKIFKSPYGELLLGDFNGKLCLCDWVYRQKIGAVKHRILHYTNAHFEEKETTLHQEVTKQLTDYFCGKLQIFDLPIVLLGTNFQVQVWKSLLQIPYGKTTTYLNQSILLGNKKAIRAVATANGNNCLAIIIPCHRIIGSNGELVGYAGGLQIKQQLLELEEALPTVQLKLF
jgi:methylated-DNA-[protein]-cysteine S-methyltransferase